MWPNWLSNWPHEKLTAVLIGLNKLGPLITGVTVTNEPTGATDVWIEKDGQEIKHVQVTGASQTVISPLVTLVTDDDSIAIATSWRP